MYAKIEAIDAVVAVAGTTLIADMAMDVADGVLALSVANTGTAAFDAFNIQVQTVPGGPWHTIANDAAGFASATLVTPLLSGNGAPVTLAAAATFFCQIDVRGIHGVRVYASANTVATTASVWSNLSGVPAR